MVKPSGCGTVLRWPIFRQWYSICLQKPHVGRWALQKRLMGQSFALISPNISLLAAKRKDREAAPVKKYGSQEKNQRIPGHCSLAQTGHSQDAKVSILTPEWSWANRINCSPNKKVKEKNKRKFA